MNAANTPKIPVWASIRRLFVLSGRLQLWFYLAVLMVVLETAATIGWNFALVRMINSVSNGQMEGFYSALWLTLGLFLVGVPLNFLHVRSVGQFSERTMALLREKIAAQAARLPMRYLEERHTGDLMSVVNADLGKLKNLTANSLLDVIRQSLLAVTALVALFVLSWQLALASTLFIPLVLVVISNLNQPIAKRTQEMQQAVGETVSVAQDGLGGLMVTRAFNLTAVMDERFQRANQSALGKGLQVARLRMFTDGGASVFGVLPFLLTFGFGGYLAINGHMTFGSLLAFVNMLNFVANPLGSLPPALASLGEAAGAAQRVYEVLDQSPERSGGQAFAPDAEDGAVVRFEGVDFTYGEEPILTQVSFSLKKGETVALVGPSGGGKSTVLKLLLGFYPVDWQRVFLFGHDMNDWSLDAARAQMAYMAQDTYLFPVSIAENIALGGPGASQAEIEHAAGQANIHDFIVSLPEGYRTLAGERGARLSGGQRQRIALARAILKDAPVLLLDEPTSALDTESEALVQEALERFMRGRTTMVVAHRLSTIRDANRVFVLEGGRIVEQGSHAQLMALEGRYSDLYQRQFDDSDKAA